MIPKEITEDLKNGMGLEECLIKHGTNLQVLFKSNYPEIVESCPEKMYIEQKNEERFYIKKKQFRSTYYYGIYSSLEDAQRVRDELIRIGWKQDQVDNICKKLGVVRVPSKIESRFYEKEEEN